MVKMPLIIIYGGITSGAGRGKSNYLAHFLHYFQVKPYEGNGSWYSYLCC
jgi:hypothetical protein